MAYFLTADGGTESLRARVYDLAGAERGSVAVPYDTRFSAGARAEQDPADWWANFVKAARGAIAEAGINPGAIEAIAYATTCCSVVALDEAGNALRPALIWMDVRANEEADAVLATGDEALRVNGGGRGPVSAEWMIPKALWLKRNEPETFDKAHRICEYQDYLTYRLTGAVGREPEQRVAPLALSQRCRRLGRFDGPFARDGSAPGEMAAPRGRAGRSDRDTDGPCGRGSGLATIGKGRARRCRRVDRNDRAWCRTTRPACPDHRIEPPAVRRDRGPVPRAGCLGHLRRCGLSRPLHRRGWADLDGFHHQLAGTADGRSRLRGTQRQGRCACPRGGWPDRAGPFPGESNSLYRRALPRRDPGPYPRP